MGQLYLGENYFKTILDFLVIWICILFITNLLDECYFRVKLDMDMYVFIMSVLATCREECTGYFTNY